MNAWFDDARRLDTAVYAAIASTETPALDRAMSRISRAANLSGLWLAAAAVLAAAGGPEGRRAAKQGLASIAVASALVNVVVKPLTRRHRPDRVAEEVPQARQVRMPGSSSFPSGHAASAFAFATGVAHAQPAAGVAVRALAGLVSYSRVHTGVHFPGDVLAGAMIGVTVAEATTRTLEARRAAAGSRQI